MRGIALYSFLGLSLIAACGGSPTDADSHAPPVVADGEAMWTAACSGDTMTVRLQLTAGVPVDYAGQKGGFSSLLCAARNGYFAVVKQLVAAGADVNKRDNARDKSPLLAASFDYHLDIVNFLIAHGADVNAQGINGWTPVHDAAYVGKLDVVQSLVAARASLAILNELGETPLATARRAVDECTSRSPHCPTTQGITDATLADFQAVVAYLTAHGG